MTLRAFAKDVIQRFRGPRLHLPPTLLVTQKRQAWASAQSDAAARVKARLESRQRFNYDKGTV